MSGSRAAKGLKRISVEDDPETAGEDEAGPVPDTMPPAVVRIELDLEPRLIVGELARSGEVFPQGKLFSAYIRRTVSMARAS